MGIHEMDTELSDIANVIVADLSKQTQEKHTELPDDAAQGSARLDVVLNILFPDAKDAALSVRIRALVLDRLVKEDVDWAVSYHTVVTESLYRPAYASAVDAGVDPAVVIAANCKIPLKEARAVARGFKKEDAAKEEKTEAGSVPDSPFDEDSE